jgi:transposase-like protein
MSKHRKHYTPEEKVSILWRHLIEKVPVSDLCQEQKLQPTVFYRWLKEFFEQGAAAFRKQFDEERKRDKERIGALEEKLKAKNEVLAELMEEHVAFKKVLGRSKGHLGASRYPGSGGGFRESLVGAS